MNKQKILTLSAAFAATTAIAVLAAGCGEEDGSGDLSTISIQNMEDRGITSVAIYEAFDVTITVDSNAPESAQLTIDDNLLDDVRVSTDNDELTIGFNDLGEDKNPSVRPVLKLTLHDLDQVRTTDDANVAVFGIDAGRFTVDQGGEGRIELTGIADELVVRARDGGDVIARNLVVKKVDLQKTDVGAIEVTVSDEISGDIDEDGDVYVFGAPSTNSVDSHGSGRLVMQ